jgi:predicted NAD/FAD-binding protein
LKFELKNREKKDKEQKKVHRIDDLLLLANTVDLVLSEFSSPAAAAAASAAPPSAASVAAAVAVSLTSTPPSWATPSSVLLS